MNRYLILFIIMGVFIVSGELYAQSEYKKWARGMVWGGRPWGADDSQWTIHQDGLDRKYKVHLPQRRGATVGVPLVIYVHGGGGDMRAAYMDGLDRMSDKHGFILAVPEGVGEVKAGHMRAKWNGGKWAGGECCGDADDVGFISRMIDEIRERYRIDTARVYATGISNGGLMVNRLACELSDKIAAIAIVAPTAVMSGCHPSRTVPVLDIHGTLDPVNPPDGSKPKGIFAKARGTVFAMPYTRMTPVQVVDAWKRINKCFGKGQEEYCDGGACCQVFDQCAQGGEVGFCLVEGMGHTYPGGSQYLPEDLVGPVTHDISFDQIWDFLKRHAILSKSRGKKQIPKQ